MTLRLITARPSWLLTDVPLAKQNCGDHTCNVSGIYFSPLHSISCIWKAGTFLGFLGFLDPDPSTTTSGIFPHYHKTFSSRFQPWMMTSSFINDITKPQVSACSERHLHDLKSTRRACGVPSRASQSLLGSTVFSCSSIIISTQKHQNNENVLLRYLPWGRAS